MATNTYPTTVLTDRKGHVFEFKDNEIREQMAELISKTETSIASATEALNAAEEAQEEATRATEYMDQVAESVAAAVDTAQEAAAAAETAQQALEDIVVTDTNGVAGTAGSDQPLQSVLDGATKPVSQYPATTAPLASTDLIIIEKANGTRSKMTYDQFIAAISNQVISKTFTSGALANYLINDANATTAGQRALDAKMGNTLNAAISTLNSRILNPTTLPTDANLNNYDSSGITIYNAGYSDNRLNAPSDWTGGLFAVMGGGGYIWQICSHYLTTSKPIYFRKKYGSTWSAWGTITPA